MTGQSTPPIGPTTRPIVIYDLDRTITTFGTYAPFLVYYAFRHNPLRLLYIPIIIFQMILYLLKLIDRKRLKTIMFDLLIGRPAKSDLVSTAAAYVDHTLRKNVYAGALITIRDWHDKRALLVLATASYDWLAEIFAQRLGFDRVVATRSVEKQGYIIAGIDGENCYGNEKLAMVTAAIGALDDLISAGHEVWVYTDHHSDISLLAKSSHPVGINPTLKLANWLEGRTNATWLKWEKIQTR